MKRPLLVGYAHGIMLLLATSCGTTRIEPPPAAVAATYDPVISTEPWTAIGPTGRVITTPSFRVFTTEQDPLFLTRIPAFLELSLASSRSRFGDLPEPRAPMNTYLLATRAEWATLTRELTGERASIYLRIQAGGFSERGRALLFDVGRRGTFGLASHEAWHQYTQTTFDQPLPLWLEEGIATMMEGSRWSSTDAALPVFLPWANVDRFDRLRELVAGGRLMPLHQLLASRPQDLLGWHSNDSAIDYYPQVWALALFLSESGHNGYADGLRAMIDDAAQGRLLQRLYRERGARAASAFAQRRVGSDLFELYIDRDLQRAERRYIRFVEQAVDRGGRDEVVAGRSPVSRQRSSIGR